MKILLVLFMLEFLDCSIILKPPRQLNQNIDTANGISNQLKRIESKNRDFAESIDKKIQEKMMQNRLEQASSQQQRNNENNQQSKNQNQSQNLQPLTHQQKTNKKDKEDKDETDLEDLNNQNQQQKNNQKEQQIDPSEREKKKDFIEPHDAMLFKKLADDDQYKIDKIKIENKILEIEPIDKHLRKNNQKAVSENQIVDEENTNETKQTSAKEIVQNKKKVENLMEIQSENNVQKEVQIKVDTEHPDRKKSEEVILTKTHTKKNSPILNLKVLISIFVLIVN